MTALLKQAAQSFYSGTFYGKLARLGRGIGVGLIFILSLLVTLLLVLAFCLGGGYDAGRVAIAKLPGIADELPAVVVKDGKLSIDKPSPYRFHIGDAPDEAWAIVDTNYTVGDVNALEQYMQQNKVFLLATRDKVISRNIHKNPGQPLQISNDLRITDVKASQPFTITHDDWRGFAAMVSNWGISLLTIALFVMLFLGVFTVNFLATMLTALLVMLLGLILKAGVEFPAASRLAAAARIPATLLGFLPIVIGHPPLAGLAGWLLWAIYLLFAVTAVKLHNAHTAS